MVSLPFFHRICCSRFNFLSRLYHFLTFINEEPLFFSCFFAYQDGRRIQPLSSGSVNFVQSIPFLQTFDLLEWMCWVIDINNKKLEWTIGMYVWVMTCELWSTDTSVWSGVRGAWHTQCSNLCDICATFVENRKKLKCIYLGVFCMVLN